MFGDLFHADHSDDIVGLETVGTNHLNWNQIALDGNWFVARQGRIVAGEDGGSVESVVTRISFQAQRAFEGDGTADILFRQTSVDAGNGDGGGDGVGADASKGTTVRDDLGGGSRGRNN